MQSQRNISEVIRPISRRAIDRDMGQNVRGRYLRKNV
jgi:hypothetical protein